DVAIDQLHPRRHRGMPHAAIWDGRRDVQENGVVGRLRSILRRACRTRSDLCVCSGSNSPNTSCPPHCKILHDTAPFSCAHWRLTSTRTRPLPSLSSVIAFPITVPGALAESVAFIACPGVDEVVNRSPGSTAPKDASTQHQTRPVIAIGCLPSAWSW